MRPCAALRGCEKIARRISACFQGVLYPYRAQTNRSWAILRGRECRPAASRSPFCQKARLFDFFTHSQLRCRGTDWATAAVRVLQIWVIRTAGLSVRSRKTRTHTFDPTESAGDVRLSARQLAATDRFHGQQIGPQSSRTRSPAVRAIVRLPTVLAISEAFHHPVHAPVEIALQLVLPDRDHVPARALQLPSVTLVATPIEFYFLAPEGW